MRDIALPDVFFMICENFGCGMQENGNLGVVIARARLRLALA
jgi:hypothetical protein